MYTIGIDIGGMSIKFGIVDKNGEIFIQSRVKTAKSAIDGVNDIINEIKRLLLENNLSVSDINGIGIGCPGAVDSEKGIMDVLPNLGWESVAIADILKEHFDLPVKISNDANVAALGEAIYGVAKDYNDCVMFTLGTGVGGGIIINKKLVEGGWSRGAELGHVTLVLDGEQCTCGRKGCIERYVSATALIEQTKKAMIADKASKMWEFVQGDIEKVDGKTAFECSKLGDKSAEKVRDTYVMYLAESMMSMFNIFRPEAFILGGGVSAQGEYLIERLKKYCEKYSYGYHHAPKTEILEAKLGNNAGIIGAAALFSK